MKKIALFALVTTGMSFSILRADWSSVPIGGGGYVTGITSSADGSQIYARTDVGGAYRWISGSGSWNPITETIPSAYNNGESFGMSSLVVAPDNAKKVYLLSGEYTTSSPCGILVTSDATVTTPVWTVVDSTIHATGNQGIKGLGERLAVDPNNTNVLYCGTFNIAAGGTGLKRYLYGTSWTSSSITQPGAIGDVSTGLTFVACDQNGGTVTLTGTTTTVSKYIYVGAYSTTAGSGGVYRTADGGSTWTKLTGVTVDQPSQGRVASDGTLYVTHAGGVVKLSRGSTTFTSITPTSQAYVALALDSNAAGTLMVASDYVNNVIYRSTNSGSSWTTISSNNHPTEPDGTPSLTTGGGATHISGLMINPTNSNEVWLSEYLSVQRTQNITSGTSDWYTLQKNFEEVVPLHLKSAPSGAPLLSAIADVDGFVHNDVVNRPTIRFNKPALQTDGGSTVSLDFCEATSGANTVLARGFVTFSGASSPGTGAVSLNDGQTWLRFGEIDSHYITGTPNSYGWEEWDLSAYLKQQKALGNNIVSLAVVSDLATDGNYAGTVNFESKENGNPPQLVINSSSTLTPTDDATVYKNTPDSTGNSPVMYTEYTGQYSNENRRILLKFDLSSVGSVTTAKLRLYRDSSSTSQYIATGVYAMASTSWSESTVTWNTSAAQSLLTGNDPQENPTLPTGSYAARVALSATDPTNLVYVDANGGVYYSKDRGVTFAAGQLSGSPLTVDSLTEFDIQKQPLASDRVAGGTFYLLGSGGTYGNGGGVVYRSTNGGATWSQIATQTGSWTYKIAAVPMISGKFWVSISNYDTPISLKYWNGSSLVNVANISNVVNYTFGAAYPGNNFPTTYALKSDGTFWNSSDVAMGPAATWAQMSVSNINEQVDILEGDRQNFGRLYAGVSGRGIYYVGGTPTSNWTRQSEAYSTTTTYPENQTVNFSTPVDAAFGSGLQDAFKYALAGSVTFNIATFGDPSPGSSKTGYFALFPLAAYESGSYTFTTPVEAAYGANGLYNYIEGISGSVTFNNATFGDPAPGQYKAGYYMPYAYCCSENQSYLFTVPTDVAFGANGAYSFMHAVTGVVNFNNSTFGDPIPGTYKSGYFRPSH